MYSVSERVISSALVTRFFRISHDTLNKTLWHVLQSFEKKYSRYLTRNLTSVMSQAWQVLLNEIVLL